MSLYPTMMKPVPLCTAGDLEKPEFLYPTYTLYYDLPTWNQSTNMYDTHYPQMMPCAQFYDTKATRTPLASLPYKYDLYTTQVIPDLANDGLWAHVFPWELDQE
jgi:hypothetical protein